SSRGARRRSGRGWHRRPACARTQSYPGGVATLAPMRLCLPMVLVAALAGWGCAGHLRAPTAADLPDDFALGLTVLPIKDAPATLAPAWYLLSPDDVLHVALGERLATSTFPPVVRTLSREQVRRMWELVVAAGLARGGQPPLPHWQVAAPNACAVVYVA